MFRVKQKHYFASFQTSLEKTLKACQYSTSKIIPVSITDSLRIVSLFIVYSTYQLLSLLLHLTVLHWGAHAFFLRFSLSSFLCIYTIIPESLSLSSLTSLDILL